jgi:hypothetical protein
MKIKYMLHKYNNTRNISAVSNPATSIDIASNNTNNTYYPVFTDSASTNRSLLIDDATTALVINIMKRMGQPRLFFLRKLYKLSGELSHRTLPNYLLTALDT